MKKAKLTIASLVLICSMALNLTACVIGAQAHDLMDGIEPGSVRVTDDFGSDAATVTNFALRLFKEANESGKNTLISPLCVMYALAMTANGAEGNTLEEMERTLGMSTDELNVYLHSYVSSITASEKYELSIANSIWFKDDERFSVNRSFLQTNADYYGADIYKAPFNLQTMSEINNWVRESTDGMIPRIINKIPSDTIMYLINALAFEAEWSNKYTDSDVREGKFTMEDGTKKTVEFMYASDGRYVEDENATGFVKYYKGSKYAFAAILPNEGISVDDYLSTLDAESLNAMLNEEHRVILKTALPKFETKYDTEMSSLLYNMGIKDAFYYATADFDGIGSYEGERIYIGSVIHKTYIKVDEDGTKAGAATAVEMDNGSASEPSQIETKYVYLDRPFIYMIIDYENNIPLFIGTMMDVKAQ